MMSLAAMLNPVDDKGLPSPATTRAASEFATPEPSPPAKKQKLAKDAPIFAKGTPVGQVNFAPYQIFSNHERALMDQFGIFPNIGPTANSGVGAISEYPRHIPYSSDKKSFLQKTGRDAFEVFQYTFKMPRSRREPKSDKEHTVMWDYNIGLVRITPFFKCQELPKTVPGKMLNSNPGLKEICHSITGGALAAQGYWMPFDAAKAVAATFCWPIRHALMPLFGPEFANICVQPGSSRYHHMVIDRAIIERCTREAGSGVTLSPTPSFATTSSTPHFTQPRYDVSNPRSKGRIDYPRRRWQSPMKLDDGRRNGTPSPTVSKQQMSTQGHSAALKANTDIPRSHPANHLPSPRTLAASQALIDACSAAASNPSSPEGSDGAISPKTSIKPAIVGDTDSLANKGSICEDSRDQDSRFDAHGPEMKAAWMLLQLHMADRNMKDHEASSPRGRKRRASA